MIIHSQDAQSFTIPGGTSGRLYPPSPKGDQSLAVVEMDGVYPITGYSLNDVCTETLFPLEGAFEVEYGADRFSLVPGDMLMLLPGKKYRIQGKGKSVVLITPSWDKKQNHIVD